MTPPPAPGEQPSPAGPSPGALVAIVATASIVLIGAVAAIISSTDPDRRATAAEAGQIDASPLDLDTVADATAAHYRGAEADPATYREVPCFCGCEEFLGHRHLYDCFVRADDRGWDAHAAGCGVCLAESAAVQELLDKGHDIAGIRDEVIARYGATTPTTATSRS